MAIKTYKPYTPARRGMTVSAFDGVDKKAKPERSLLETLKKNSGRNSYGRITVRHRGGGNKRKYRVIDFRRDKLDMPAVVQRLEYDPNRSAFIALVKYEDGELRYVLAPVGLKAGDTILASAAADIKPGNALPIRNIPLGTLIHNIEIVPGRGGQLRAQRLQAVAAHLLRGGQHTVPPRDNSIGIHIIGQLPYPARKNSIHSYALLLRLIKISAERRFGGGPGRNQIDPGSGGAAAAGVVEAPGRGHDLPIPDDADGGGQAGGAAGIGDLRSAVQEYIDQPFLHGLQVVRVGSKADQ